MWDTGAQAKVVHKNRPLWGTERGGDMRPREAGVTIIATRAAVGGGPYGKF